jgi:hypothetical protein
VWNEISRSGFADHDARGMRNPTASNSSVRESDTTIRFGSKGGFGLWQNAVF